MTADPGTDPPPGLHEALRLEPDGPDLVGRVHEGWDAFGAGHGGYLLALAGKALLTATGAPDLFTVTAHYLRRTRPGPLRFHLAPVGGSRRFRSVAGTGTQDGEVVLAVTALVGDRSAFAGPTWSREKPWDPATARLTPRGAATAPGGGGQPVPVPAFATRAGSRLDTARAGFAAGAPDGSGEVRAVLEDLPADQLGALLACDATPPAAWNVLGPLGWVPTVELTAHVRARSGTGPLSVQARCEQVAGGFLAEDAVVHDAEGRLIVQSRQLALWTA